MSMAIYDKHLDPNDKDCIVTKIVVTASDTVSTVEDMPSIFHWQIYLVIEPGQSQNNSVVIDMQPANPPIGVMIITSNPNARSTAINKIELDILTRDGPTVNQIIDVFLEHRMQFYKFDDTGSGCLYWIFTGLRFLEERGLVEQGAVEKLEKFHLEQAGIHPERHPMPLRKGVFY